MQLTRHFALNGQFLAILTDIMTDGTPYIQIFALTSSDGTKTVHLSIKVEVDEQNQVFTIVGKLPTFL